MAWLIWVLFFARSVLKAPWRRLASSEQLNVWLGMVVLLTLFWSLKAGAKPGLNLHLLGATVFTLCFGPHLAFIGLCLALLGVTLNGAAGTFSYALNALLMAGVGVFCAHTLHRLATRLLPAQIFVFIFANGFFNAALTILGVGLGVTLVLAFSGAYSWDYLSGDYFPYFMLLGFSEAWLSGMLTTLFIVYRPSWISSFDDSRYLANK